MHWSALTRTSTEVLNVGGPIVAGSQVPSAAYPPNMVALLDDFSLTPRHWGWHLLAFNHIVSLQTSFFDSFNERINNKIKD